jgi:hypothetical protein
VADTFWRVDTGRANQSEQVARTQQRTMKVCGRGSSQSGGGTSSIPAVRAYFGVLPAAEKGIQFETAVKPYSTNRRQGGLVTWPLGHTGVVDEGNGLVCIPITAIVLRY